MWFSDRSRNSLVQKDNYNFCFHYQHLKQYSGAIHLWIGIPIPQWHFPLSEFEPEDPALVWYSELSLLPSRTASILSSIWRYLRRKCPATCHVDLSPRLAHFVSRQIPSSQRDSPCHFLADNRFQTSPLPK